MVRYNYLLRGVGGALLSMVLVAPVAARPVHKQAFADYFGPVLAKKLNDCRACHLADQPGQEEGVKPHNVFGVRVAAVRSELRAAKKPDDLVAALLVIFDEDADGDGVENLTELLAGRFPGDKDDSPSKAELENANKNLVALQKYKSGYPWRPFQTVKRPPTPTVSKNGWAKNPIDVFIAAEHQERDLKPRPEAPRPILVRRIYLDLIGLPPTRAELAAAVNDSSEDWYEKVVDTLLASPRHGERWGRHWMDVWRYSDWHAFANDVRFSQPHIWRWRDWIIESVNEDKPYDRMILEMLAGDELAPDDPQVVRATGYLARNYNILDRNVWLQDVVNHTFQGFLGLTVGCARCHDHMYDPMTQKEYFQLRAFFEPYRVRIDAVPGMLEKPRINIGNGATLVGDGFVRVFDADAKTPTYLFVRGEPTMPDKTAPLSYGVPEALGGRLPEIAPVPLSSSVYDPDKRDFVVRDMIAASDAGIRQAEEKLAKAEQSDVKELAEAEVQQAKGRHAALLAVLEAERLEDAGKIDSDEGKAAVAGAVRAQRQQALLEAKRYVVASKKRLADPKTSAVAVKELPVAEKQLAKAEMDLQLPLNSNYVKRAIKSYPKESTGRRSSLARWIVDKENPLTSRVAMNHLWLRHFGQGLAANPFDFGRNAAAPTHPALLDWLACEFMEPANHEATGSGGGWSMKRMQRLMVTSATYRMASTTDPELVARDRDNLYLSRMSPRRMESELVRDSFFYLADTLDFAMGGIDIDYAKGNYVPRRSLYFHHSQDHQAEFLKLFDNPSVDECYQRNSSVMPQQALALANSDLAVQKSRVAARNLSAMYGEVEPFVIGAFEHVLSRPPTSAELAECVEFLQAQAKLYRPNPNPASVVDERKPSPEPAIRARENFVRILFNHNDFVTIR